MSDFKDNKVGYLKISRKIDDEGSENWSANYTKKDENIRKSGKEPALITQYPW